MPHWRIYADGREFGIDYATLEEAQEVKSLYARTFTHTNYYIRKHG